MLYVHCVEGQHELTTDYDIREWMEGGGEGRVTQFLCHSMSLCHVVTCYDILNKLVTAHDECDKQYHHVEEGEQSGSAFPKALFHRKALPYTYTTNVESSKSYSVQIKCVFTGSSEVFKGHK